MPKYCIGLNEHTIDIVTFLNDGVRPEIKENTFLVCVVNGPREITTKVMTLEEINAEIHTADLEELF